MIETVRKHCKHPDCAYRGLVSSIPCCDYILIKKESRGCKISECTRYLSGKKKTNLMHLEPTYTIEQE